MTHILKALPKCKLAYRQSAKRLHLVRLWSQSLIISMVKSTRDCISLNSYKKWPHLQCYSHWGKVRITCKILDTIQVVIRLWQVCRGWHGQTKICSWDRPSIIIVIMGKLETSNLLHGFKNVVIYWLTNARNKFTNLWTQVDMNI